MMHRGATLQARPALLASTVAFTLTLAAVTWQLLTTGSGASGASKPSATTIAAAARPRAATGNGSPAQRPGPARHGGRAAVGGSTAGGGSTALGVSTGSGAIAGAEATAMVGALFTTRAGQLGSHFCTASVIHSPSGNLLITAAHCVAGYNAASPADLAFVPGYDGTAPLGIWKVTRIYVDSAWATAENPDDDVAFLTVTQPGSGTRIEGLTGAAELGVGQAAAGQVRVVGYPDTQNQPISCSNSIRVFSASQLEFDCNNFTNGTSGSPFLAGPDPVTRSATVIGVIGGYQQGGLTADVSYAATFGQNVTDLYDTAVSSG